MYLRFIASEIDNSTGKERGIFSIAYDLLRSGSLIKEEEDKLRIALMNCERILPIPDKFSRKKNDSHKNHKGISWIKDNASEIIREIRIIKKVLDENNLFIEVIKTQRPGYVVYEDDFQIVAEPFNNEKVMKK